MQADQHSRGVALFEGPHLSLLSIASDPLAVREGLRALFDTAMLRALPLAARGTAEIVLAEALNTLSNTPMMMAADRSAGASAA